MNIVVDIGSSNTKIGIFQDKNLEFFQTYLNSEISTIGNIFKSYSKIEKGIISSVSNISNKVHEILTKNFVPCIIFDNNTKIPIKNLYQSAGLGKDRLAAAIGANYLYPNRNILIIDFGTAITIDFINDKNEYFGGNISPGLTSRFKALNQYSDNLPLFSNSENFSLTGKNTEEAIINGVQNGIICEIDSYIEKYLNIYKNIKILATGGDSVFFEKKLKNTIFVVSKLILIGLHRILGYNEGNF